MGGDSIRAFAFLFADSFYILLTLRQNHLPQQLHLRNFRLHGGGDAGNFKIE